MLIRIKYHNDKFDYIKPYFLDHLIKTDRIKAFRRKTGWVIIGMDKICGGGRNNFKGTERRKMEQFNPFALVYLYLVLSYKSDLRKTNKKGESFDTRFLMG